MTHETDMQDGPRPQVYKLNYESLIALLQGKELHLQTGKEHFIFKPPFDGLFMMHDAIARLRHQNMAGFL